MNPVITDKYNQRPRKWKANLLLGVVFIIVISLSFMGSSINWYRLSNLQYSLGVMIRDIVKIDWNFFFGTGGFDFDQGIVYLTIETLAIAFLGTLIGAILAIPFGLLAAENVVGKKWARVSEGLLVLIRVLPEVILAIILLKGFGMNAFTGALTIGIHSIGMLGKLFAEAVDNMDRSALEALDAVGANTWQKIRFGILPNLLPDFSSITLYRFDINVRSASVLGVISAGGLGAPLLIASTNWSWEMLGSIMVAIIIMVMSVDVLSGYLRKKLV